MHSIMWLRFINQKADVLAKYGHSNESVEIFWKKVFPLILFFFPPRFFSLLLINACLIMFGLYDFDELRYDAMQSGVSNVDDGAGMPKLLKNVRRQQSSEWWP